MTDDPNDQGYQGKRQLLENLLLMSYLITKVTIIHHIDNKTTCRYGEKHGRGRHAWLDTILLWISKAKIVYIYFDFCSFSCSHRICHHFIDSLYRCVLLLSLFTLFGQVILNFWYTWLTNYPLFSYTIRLQNRWWLQYWFAILRKSELFW